METRYNADAAHRWLRDCLVRVLDDPTLKGPAVRAAPAASDVCQAGRFQRPVLPAVNGVSFSLCLPDQGLVSKRLEEAKDKADPTARVRNQSKRLFA